jgi:hypothetical protein
MSHVSTNHPTSISFPGEGSQESLGNEEMIVDSFLDEV